MFELRAPAEQSCWQTASVRGHIELYYRRAAAVWCCCRKTDVSVEQNEIKWELIWALSPTKVNASICNPPPGPNLYSSSLPELFKIRGVGQELIFRRFLSPPPPSNIYYFDNDLYSCGIGSGRAAVTCQACWVGSDWAALFVLKPHTGRHVGDYCLSQSFSRPKLSLFSPPPF